jgi:hypothetical protein
MAGGQDNGGKMGSEGKEELLERKKTLEKELLIVEQRLTQQADEVSNEGKGAAASKKHKKEKPVKVKKEKKAKAPKAHPSSKAGPGFTVTLTHDMHVEVVNINKKGHAYKSCGLREGDVLLRIHEQDVSAMNLNDVKSKLVAKCGTVLHLDLNRPAVAGAGGSSTFADWLASTRDTTETRLVFAGAYTADVVVEFAPLVKTIKAGNEFTCFSSTEVHILTPEEPAGKPAQRGEAAELSLQMADSLLKRELLFVAGALQPLCKLLIDPKAADQVNRGISALKNMLRIAMWTEVSVALSAMGKPLVQVLSLLALLVY